MTNHKKMNIQAGTLYVVGTPIGNLEDMTFRAIQVLQQVDLIAAEDTRHTGKLLQHFQIATSQTSYHDHNRAARTPDLLARLHQGQAIALVTDAGMPGISDPGVDLVQACIANQIPVVPIPGCSAVTTALSAAGLPTDRFVFEGFLPAKSKARCDRLAQLTHESRTLVFYESPYRLRETLADMTKFFGEARAIVLARELTKLHEEFWRGTLSAALTHYTDHTPKGEFTLLVAGANLADQSGVQVTQDDLKAALSSFLHLGFSPSQASREVAQQTGHPRRDLYQLALTLRVAEQPDLDPDLPN